VNFRVGLVPWVMVIPSGCAALSVLQYCYRSIDC
jgi:hypothetical protein